MTVKYYALSNERKFIMKSIRSKILTMIGIPLLIAMTLSSVFTSSTTGKIFFENSKDLTQSETNLLASKAENYLSHYQSMVMQMAHSEDVRKLLSTNSKGDNITKSPYFSSSKNMLASTQSKDTENIVSAYIADVDPSVVFDGGKFVSGKDYILTEKDYHIHNADFNHFLKQDFTEIHSLKDYLILLN